MGNAVGSLVFGKCAQMFSRRMILLSACSTMMGVATIWFIYFTTSDSSFWLVVFLSAMNGIGSGGSTPIHYIMVREYNHFQQCEDAATGFVNVQRTSSGFIAQLLMGIMMD